MRVSNITTPGRHRPGHGGWQSLGQHLRCSGSRRLLLLLVVERAAEEHDVRLRPVDRIVHPPAALLHADGTPLVLQNSPHKTQPSGKRSKNTIYTNVGWIQVMYLGEEAVLGEELGDLGREDDVPAPTKGDRG
jgi:hypothetical protein